MSTGTTALRQSMRERLLRGSRRLESEMAQGTGRIVGIAAVAAGVALAIFATCFAGAWLVVARGAPELVRTGASFGLLFLSGALVLSSLGHAAQAFFSAKDLWFWDSSPAPMWARFLDRATETAINAAPTTLALGSIGMTGLVLGGHVGVLGALRGLLAVGLIVLIPISAGILLAHVGGALLPAGQLRRVSILVLGCAVAAVLVWFREARVEKVLTPEGAAELLASARSASAGPAGLPSSLGGRFIVDGDGVAFLGMLGWCAVFVVAALLAHKLLSRRARDLAVDESPVGIVYGSARDRALKLLIAPAPAKLRPMVEKDLLAFVRDPAQWGQVVLLGGVGVLYLVNARALKDGFAQMRDIGDAVLPAMHTGLITFIAAGLAARFAFPQMGLEGPAVWIVDGSPLPPRPLMTAKWIAALPVVVIYPSLVAVIGGFVLDLKPSLWIATTILCVTVSAGVAAYGVGRGAIKPLYDATSLSELAMGPGAITTMMAATALAFLASVAALVAGACVVGMENRFGDWTPQLTAIAFVATLFPSLLAIVLGKKSLDEGAVAFVRRREDEATRAWLAQMSGNPSAHAFVADE